MRVLLACESAGVAPTGAERTARIPKGYVSRLIYGHRGATSINPRHMDALARVLHVSFEWLVLGTGPMKARADYGPATVTRTARASGGTRLDSSNVHQIARRR
jgi:hypothetical protein